MKKKLFLLLTVFLVLLILLIGTPAFADFQKGLDAANRGDFATALKEWRPLAEQGDADAQHSQDDRQHKGNGEGRHEDHHEDLRKRTVTLLLVGLILVLVFAVGRYRSLRRGLAAVA